jgi:peptidoglycan/xylan/chitin deacetylase (PgdA/CDA1 family)
LYKGMTTDTSGVMDCIEQFPLAAGLTDLRSLSNRGAHCYYSFGVISATQRRLARVTRGSLLLPNVFQVFAFLIHRDEIRGVYTTQCRAPRFLPMFDVKGALKRFLYASGVLSGYHRIRNRDVLTVATFHRVLAPGDPRCDGAIPEWTLAETVFEECLAFFERHYTVVSLYDVLAALRGDRALPPRSLLLTFDDGYADNIDYALPVLRRHGLPAVVFVISDAIDQRWRPWTEDFLHAYLSGEITPDEVRSIYSLVRGEAAGAASSTPAQVMEIVRYGPQLSEEDVKVVFSKLRRPLTRVGDPAQMLSVEQIRRLVRDGVAIAAHGKTHVSFPLARDVTAELREPRRVLTEILAADSGDAICAMSFPHGAYTPQIVRQAMAEGYRLMFTTGEGLSPLMRGRLTMPLVGRVNVSGPAFARHGRLQPELLAYHFFRRPHAGRAGSV